MLLRMLNADGQVRVLRAFTADEDIFRGFGLDAVPEQELRQPFCGFRIQMELAVTNILCGAELVPPNALRLAGGGYLMLRGK